MCLRVFDAHLLPLGQEFPEGGITNATNFWVSDWVPFGGKSDSYVRIIVDGDDHCKELTSTKTKVLNEGGRFQFGTNVNLPQGGLMYRLYRCWDVPSLQGVRIAAAAVVVAVLFQLGFSPFMLGGFPYCPAVALARCCCRLVWVV